MPGHKGSNLSMMMGNNQTKNNRYEILNIYSIDYNNRNNCNI